MEEEKILIELIWGNQPKAMLKFRLEPSTLREMHETLVEAKPIFECKEYVYMYEDSPFSGSFGISLKRETSEESCS
jgi:hypothetical protein